MRIDLPSESDEPGLGSLRDDKPLREGDDDESTSGSPRDVVSGDLSPLVVVLDGNRDEDGRAEGALDDGESRGADDVEEPDFVLDGLLPPSRISLRLFPLPDVPLVVPLGGFVCDLSPGD
jgi:hypothetical protein